MKFTFQNLGALEVGEIELADLTIICGENNTGKTYVTYLVYCLLTAWRRLIDLNLNDALRDLRKNGVVKINIQTVLANDWETICSNALVRFKKSFPEMLASKSELFSKFELSVDIPLNNIWKNNSYKKSLHSENGNLLFTLEKSANSSEIEIVAPENKNIDRLRLNSARLFRNFIQEAILDLTLENIIPNVFIASTERTGATTFKKQLNLATNNLIDLLSLAHKKGEDSITPDILFDTMYGGTEYAIPIKHNVSFLNQLPNNNAENGKLFSQSPNLLAKFEEIVGGTYVTNKEGNTYFQPKCSKLKLGLGEASSSVRSLLIVWYWLKYYAKKGDMLMLDEPELNLHPENQRKLARFIVALINNGVKVFITTHSDYIVKEFNTLIMLNQDSPKLDAIRKIYKDYKNDDKLDYKKVTLYMVGDNKIIKPGNKRKTKVKTLIKADISETLGISAVSFDKTIDDINNVQDAIYYAIN